jgi:SAM-dependent methyltransferase
LGRTTLWLARRCRHVVAIDVSQAHLAIAREALAARGVGNVEFRLLRQPRDLVMEGIDFFHSMIVLQHNPPPIIAEILQHAFSGLRPGGSAFFQVPTYGVQYSWSLEGYVANTLPRGETEMHVIPQSVVFALAAQAGCVPLEMQRDGYAQMPPWVSNTFLIVKEAGRGGKNGQRAGTPGLLRRLIAPAHETR